MTKDATPITLGVAVTAAAALYFFIQNIYLRQQINDCQVKHEGFKEGVIYAK